MLARAAAALPRSPRLGRPRLPVPSRRATVVLAVLAVLAGGFLLVRDSSLVAVHHVEVTGATGPQAASVRTALEAAGKDMTTLNVRDDVLEGAVARYPIVRDLRVDADFPRTLRVEVVQHEPVGIAAGVPVAADGTVLRGARVGTAAELPARTAPAGERVADARTLRAVRLLAAAPAALRPRVARVFLGPRGLTARLTKGPSVHFGPSDRLAAKWAAAAAVLAASSSQGATYIDVRYPERPVAGGLEPLIGEEAPSTTP